MPEPNVLRQQRNYLVCFDLTAGREICEIEEVPTGRKHSWHSVAAVNMSTLTALHRQKDFSRRTSTGRTAKLSPWIQSRMSDGQISCV